MSESDAQSVRKWQPRFSLLTVLLLMTIAGMGIVIAQLWRDVRPLRAEVRNLRTELGYLNIDDPERAVAIQLQTGEPRHWRWRIYLPPNGVYRELCYSGTLPSPKDFSGKAWFDQVENGHTGTGSSGTIQGGEFTLDARLVKEGNRWALRLTKSGGRGTGGITIAQPSGDWLSDLETFSSSSGISSREPTLFVPGEPIMLLKVVKPEITRFQGGYSSRDPQGAADGFVLWFEPPTPTPVNKAKP